MNLSPQEIQEMMEECKLTEENLISYEEFIGVLVIIKLIKSNWIVPRRHWRKLKKVIQNLELVCNLAVKAYVFLNFIFRFLKANKKG